MSLNEKNINAMLVVEVIGRPKEYLIETLEEIIKNISEEKGVKIIEKKINEPILIKNQTDFFTTFAEIEIDVEEIMKLVEIMFKYMPAHVEIIYPEVIGLTNNGWNDIFAELVTKLHGYDEVARIIENEKIILEKKLKELEGKKE